MRLTQPTFSRVLVLLALAALAACGGAPPPGGSAPDGGTTEAGSPSGTGGHEGFTTVERGASGTGGSSSSGGAAHDAGSAPSPGPAAPAGRVAEVEEADIYKLVGTRLYYLNTYRGFLVYDVANAAQPSPVARLPVYGYPVEMFVDGNVVHAVLRDALYLSEVGGKLQFQRHNVSQLVSIDVSDPSQPRVIKTLDITGTLQEGVTRKVDKTIYVVSRLSRWQHSWPGSDGEGRDEAWVYSYDVSDPANPREAGRLSIFSAEPSPPRAASYRNVNGVTISATANALMVVENWYLSGSSGPCGFFGRQEAVVSLIDISDPTGLIRRHTRFATEGTLSDQFKMAYRSDAATGQAIFFGIFAQQNWDGGCGRGFETRNTLESWDISDGAKPTRLAALPFGKPQETVQGSTFDLSRNVVYAITARQIDPLYAIDISDPKKPHIRSEIDGLSGSISVFRVVGGGKFLLGVGQDQSTACEGFADGDPTWRNTKMAVTVIDVANLDQIRLVQRKCVAIKNAAWTSSAITWNQDQAHKMLGMFQDGDTNILTVPVGYAVEREAGQGIGWWYNWQTAVGLLSWDLSRYDATKPPAQQTVVQSYGTFVHPEGQVERSILFRHPTTGARSMINVSHTHLSLANIDDLAQPRLDGIVEVAPSVSEVHVFGDHVVERVDLGQSWSPSSVAEFRVKPAGTNLNAKAPVATFQVGQATGVYRLGEALVILRRAVAPAVGNAPWDYSSPIEAVIYDLSTPSQPKLASRLVVPFEPYRYYGYSCGMGYRGYWFGQGEQTIVTSAGIAQVRMNWQPSGDRSARLAFLDLRDLNAPKVHDRALSYPDPSALSLVADGSAGAPFYLVHREFLGHFSEDGPGFTRSRYFAQRWTTGPEGPQPGENVNLPGTLAKTWIDSGGTRRFLTHDAVWGPGSMPEPSWWQSDSRLNLLRQVGGRAELLGSRTFSKATLQSLILEGDQLFVAAHSSDRWDPTTSSWTSWERSSDRLVILDVAGPTLASIYEQPTRTYRLTLMGVKDKTLFMNLPGDGLITVDVSSPAEPRGRRFLRTLGWGSHVQFAGSQIYVAAGSFGVFDFPLGEPAQLPPQM